jgi:dipeptidyl aminopeptidase/acylaminoacyl peptidase
MKRVVSSCLVLLAGAVAVAAQAPGGSFTIEQVLSAPFPSELRAAPAGNRVAWAFDARGQRNIWVAEGPAFKARRLTAYEADDGQEITAITWSPDGRTIVYVRGGPKNQAGEIPNPTSNPAGAEQAVWAVSVDGGTPRKLGLGDAPEVSPGGDRVAFLKDGQVWVAPLDGKAEATQFFVVRGTLSSQAWSPDGSRLAFVSSRSDHSFIGVYDTRQKSVSYLAPGVDRDGDPCWSPDGKRIAFVRTLSAGGPGGMGTDPERDIPWAIWVAEASSGEGREVWRAPARAGGTQSRLAGRSLHHWATQDRLVFTAELDGWNRLYSLAVPGSAGVSPATVQRSAPEKAGETPAFPEPLALSAAECEVESLATTPDREQVVFTSNCGDIERRHLWRAAVAEAGAAQVTTGQGIEWDAQVLSDGRAVAFFASDARRPASPQVAALAGGQPRAIARETIPADFPLQELVEPQVVVFKAADGLEIHGQLFLPAASAAGGGPRPAVIFVHGGPIRQMLPAWHYGYYYHNSYGYNQYLAGRGYVVLSVNFRSGIGYGRAFRNAPKRGARGASEYQDVVAAAQFLRARADVDPARIGIWGGSYGGYLTALALARNSDLFAAGVDLHGVHDWSARLRAAGTAAAAPADSAATNLARESSPVAAVKTWRSPVLLIHGDDDRNVNFSQTVELVARLREQKVPFEQIVYPDEVHDFLRHAHWLEAYRAATRFFDQYLKK